MLKIKIKNAYEISFDEMFEWFAEDFDDNYEMYDVIPKKFKKEIKKLSENDSVSDYLRNNYPDECLKILHTWIDDLFDESNFFIVEINNNNKTEYHYFEKIKEYH